MRKAAQEPERLPFGWENRTGEIERSASFLHFEHDSGIRLYVRPYEVVVVLPHFKRTFVRASGKGLEFWKGVYPVKGWAEFEAKAKRLSEPEKSQVVEQLMGTNSEQLGLALKNKKHFESFYRFLRLIDEYNQKARIRSPTRHK